MHTQTHLKITNSTQNAFRGAKKITQKNLRLLYINNNLGSPRIGIQITKKAVRLAVTRNKLRRLIRESFRSRSTELGSYDILLLITLKISSEKQQISDILMQEWKLSINLLQQSQ